MPLRRRQLTYTGISCVGQALWRDAIAARQDIGPAMVNWWAQGVVLHGGEDAAEHGVMEICMGTMQRQLLKQPATLRKRVLSL